MKNHSYQAIEIKIQEKQLEILEMQVRFDELASSKNGHPALNLFALRGLQGRIEVARAELHELKCELPAFRIDNGCFWIFYLLAVLILLGFAVYVFSGVAA